MPQVNRRKFMSLTSGVGLASLAMAARPTPLLSSALRALSPTLAVNRTEATVQGAHSYSGNIQIDISKVPFSRYGSYAAFSHLAPSQSTREGLYLRTLHGEVSHREVFRLQLLNGRNPVPFKEIATPTLLRLEAADGEVEICMAEPRVIRIRGRGVGLRLAAPHPSAEYAYASVYEYALPVDKSHWEVNSFSQRVTFMISSLGGNLVVDAPWEGTESEHITADFLPDFATGTFEGAIEEFSNSWNPRGYSNSFDVALKALDHEYHSWLEKMPEVPEEFGTAAELAAYVDWESVVAADGHLTRPAMLMSKNWMTNLWSWDHCFNAMALTFKNPQLAWDQYMVVFDNQNGDGELPDLMNDQTAEWNFTKPPIHGWALEWMMERTQWINNQRLVKAYEPLALWTDWYFKYRDSDHDGLPEYNHGNDSGWDNSTVFLMRPPLETPDLSAFLVLQMNALSNIARRLSKHAEAEKWKERGDTLLRLMLAKLWREDHFVVLEAGDHAVDESSSLLLYLPIVLGKMLPEQVRTKLIAGLARKGQYLTEHGFASESLRSPYYVPDGYWRGPIWAPTTMIIAEGLDAAGERKLARELRLKFCRMVAESGMSENFDAITGTGLRDPAYTWTSSVFLIFAHQLLEQSS